MGVPANLVSPLISRPVEPGDSEPTSFTTKQIRVLEALVTRQVGESLAQVADRAGVGRVSIYRWLKDPAFHREYRERVAVDLSSKRSLMAEALVRGGLKEGPGQAAMQKMYWQLVGDFKDSLEISGPDGQPIQIQSNIVVDTLPLYVKQLLVVVSSGKSVSQELERRILEEVGEKFLEVEYEVMGTADKREVKSLPPPVVPVVSSAGDVPISFTRGSASLWEEEENENEEEDEEEDSATAHMINWDEL